LVRNSHLYLTFIVPLVVAIPNKFEKKKEKENKKERKRK
jgi:hypothetical protein